MAKWNGKIGYVENVETEPGIWEPVVTEKPYSGDLLFNMSQWVNSSGVNDDLKLANKISVIADPFAYNNFQHIKYLEFMGTLWKVTTAEVNYPRIILSIGGVYNGEQARTTE